MTGLDFYGHGDRDARDALKACEQTFRHWLGDSYDLDVIRLCLAATAVEKMSGDLIWVLVLGGSGAGKTESVMPFQSVGGVVASTVTEASLLSGSSKRDHAKDATGGLLRQIGDSGLLILKDVTTILSMSGDARSQVLAALREIYDGHWVRNIGTDGGRTLEWRGRIAVLGAVTSAWDKAHAVISEMGERFLIVRPVEPDPFALALSAMSKTGEEVEMRAALEEAVAEVITRANTGAPIGFQDLSEPQRHRLRDLARVVTLARSPVATDFRGEPEAPMRPEQPTRFAKQLLQVVRGAVAVGMSTDDAITLAARVAHDSVPPIRLAVLGYLLDHPEASQRDVMDDLNLPKTSAGRVLGTLQLIGIVKASVVRITDDRSHRYYSIAEGVQDGLRLLLAAGPADANGSPRDAA